MGPNVFSPKNEQYSYLPSCLFGWISYQNREEIKLKDICFIFCSPAWNKYFFFVDFVSLLIQAIYFPPPDVQRDIMMLPNLIAEVRCQTCKAHLLQTKYPPTPPPNN